MKKIIPHQPSGTKTLEVGLIPRGDGVDICAFDPNDGEDMERLIHLSPAGVFFYKGLEHLEDFFFRLDGDGTLPVEGSGDFADKEGV